MPLSKPTPKISLHAPTTPFTTTPPCHLTTIPPELLLSILSHVSPSTLYPLSQTSKHIHTFLHTHAASICNTHITTHYSHASSILRSQFNGSWLLPSHPAILNEERRIQRDKILFSGCKCTPCRANLASSSSVDVSMGDEAVQDLPAERREGCKAQKDIDSCLKLSAPGPQYVMFLEKYSWEIVTRWSMGRVSAPDAVPLPPSPTSSTSTAADAEDEDGGDGEEERQRQQREKEEAMFEFMVGNYCVRRFLDAAEKTVASIPSAETTQTPSSPKVQFQRLQRRLRKRMRASKEKAVSVQVEEVVLDDEIGAERQRAVPTQGRRMMFGEISPASPNEIDEKTSLVQKKGGERWEDGLLWYYGLPSLRVSSEPEQEVEVEMQEKGFEKQRGCVAVFKRGLGIIGRRVRGMFLGRCLGLRRGVGVGFRALEG